MAKESWKEYFKAMGWRGRCILGLTLAAAMILLTVISLDSAGFHSPATMIFVEVALWLEIVVAGLMLYHVIRHGSIRDSSFFKK